MLDDSVLCRRPSHSHTPWRRDLRRRRECRLLCAEFLQHTRPLEGFAVALFLTIPHERSEPTGHLTTNRQVKHKPCAITEEKQLVVIAPDKETKHVLRCRTPPATPRQLAVVNLLDECSFQALSRRVWRSHARPPLERHLRDFFGFFFACNTVSCGPLFQPGKPRLTRRLSASSHAVLHLLIKEDGRRNRALRGGLKRHL
mmetsp:Transcript_39928/g.105965  ORF Transcript_39928/g.105965 Transcript_39928/m.105965 type:complete len:200 (+) Transcript_39928:321-920(+)